MADWFQLNPPAVANWFSRNQPAATQQQPQPQPPRMIQGDDSVNMAAFKAYLGAQPAAQTRIGRVSIYPFAGPVPGTGGQYYPNADAITINANASEGQISGIIRHEVTHKVLQPHLEAMEKDQALAGFIPKIQQGLMGPGYGNLYNGPDGKGVNPQAALSEGIAYRSGAPLVPGLTGEESRNFMEQALRNADPKLRAQVQSLAHEAGTSH